MRKVPESRMAPKPSPFGGRKERFPWDLWLDGKPTELVRGEDWDSHISADNFIATCRQAAKRRGLKLRGTKDSEDVIVIQSW